MRTIIVVFSDKVLPSINLKALKKYKFLCNYDNIKAYDIITDPRYTNKMLVIGTNSCTDRVQEGITLKDIYIIEVNGHTINQPARLILGSLVGNDYDINKQRISTMEEKRNIKLTLKEAVEWYNSGNITLRALALKAYTEDELTLNLQCITSKVNSTKLCANIPQEDNDKYNTLADLAMIAKYFNGNWKRTLFNTGYFLCQNRDSNINYTADYYNDACICQHIATKDAGVVYFKNREDAVKAIKILGKRVKNLFN